MARAVINLRGVERVNRFIPGLIAGRQMARLCGDRGYHFQAHDEVDVVIEHLCVGSTLGSNVRINPALSRWNNCDAT